MVSTFSKEGRLKMDESLIFKSIRRILPGTMKSRLIQLYHCILLTQACDEWSIAVLDRLNIKPRKYSNKDILLKLRNGDKIFFKLDNLDAQRIAEIFGENIYTPAYLSTYWSDPKVVLDIGANTGVFTLYAARLFPEATIHAYEPNPDLFPLLKKNILLNGLQERCALSNCAVWHESDTLHFTLGNAKNPGTGQIVRDGKEEQNVKSVPAIGFMNILEMHQKVDFIKMDIEGSEYEVILQSHPNYLRKVKFFALEYHKRADGNVHDLIRHLEAAHFSTALRTRGSILYAWQKPEE